MKKTYITPGFMLVTLQSQTVMTVVSGVTETQGNAGLNSPTAGNGEARTKEQINLWDEEW